MDDLVFELPREEPSELPIEYIEPSELKNKTVIIKKPKKTYYGEPYSFKITNANTELGSKYSFLLSIRVAFNFKPLELIEWFLIRTNKQNMFKIDKIEELCNKLNISKATFYRWLGSLEKENLIVKVSKNKYMWNPQIIINYRKIKNQDIPDLVVLYNQYKGKIKWN